MDQPESASTSKKKLTSEQFDAFFEALKTLYVRGNQSGRIRFIKKWDIVAPYIFEPELIQYDTEGGGTRERKAELEHAAEERQLALLDILETLEDKSAQNGALNTEYVHGLIGAWGRDLSLHIYAEHIVDRFAPPEKPQIEPSAVVDVDPLPSPPSEQPFVHRESSDTPPPAVQPHVDIHTLDPLEDENIRPIDLSAPPSTQAMPIFPDAEPPVMDTEPDSQTAPPSTSPLYSAAPPPASPYATTDAPVITPPEPEPSQLAARPAVESASPTPTATQPSPPNPSLSKEEHITFVPSKKEENDQD
ncbi:MAG: hypothetical protein KDI46_07880 [Alphaproteobacteria bacterium]|nr:hypothetical protein [Alphaproteobacteria bacterium]